MKYEEVKNLKRGEFKRLCGVYPETFEKMVSIIEKAQKKKRKLGRPSRLSLADQVMMTLAYLREYRTYFHIAQTWGVHESTAHRIIERTTKTLISSREFKLPGKKQLLQEELAPETVVIDVTEIAVERPLKKRVRNFEGTSKCKTHSRQQKSYYSGKKKRHTVKVQVVVEQETGIILCTDYEKGKKHDFRIFKENQVLLRQTTFCLTDKGYQGIQKYHPHSQTPVKKRRNTPLTRSQKQQNRLLASQRVIGEHINRRVKIFRVFSGVYRNRRKGFALRFNLIAGLHNFELTLPKFKSF